MTKLEEYLDVILIQEKTMFDEESFIKENDLENPKRLNKFKIAGWMMYPIIPLIPIGMYATETNNKHMLLVTLIIGFFLILSSFIASKMNKSLEDLKTEWIQKEWEFFTGIKYRMTPFDAFGSYDILFETYVLEDDNHKFLEKLKEIPEEEKQKKFLRRALGTKGY